MNVEQSTKQQLQAKGVPSALRSTAVDTRLGFSASRTTVGRFALHLNFHKFQHASMICTCRSTPGLQDALVSNVSALNSHTINWSLVTHSSLQSTHLSNPLIRSFPLLAAQCFCQYSVRRLCPLCSLDRKPDLLSFHAIARPHHPAQPHQKSDRCASRIQDLQIKRTVKEYIARTSGQAIAFCTTNTSL